MLKNFDTQNMCLMRKQNVRKLSFTHLKSLKKNDRNGGVWQSGISKSLAEYVQRCVCFVNVQSFLHENVVFSVCARTSYLSGGIPFPV